jgi:phenylalanyl-tRNA synthetase beta chain
MVIADSKRPVGVAGVMGGSETEVDANTTEVLLEVASFDMYTIRRSAMRHGLFTDAFTRFSKGQSPLQNDRALAKFIEMLREMVGAELSSDVADLQSSAVQEMGSRYSVHPGVVVSGEFINSRLGTSLSNEQIANILRNVEMAVLDVEGGMEITAPFWRTDIEQKEDVVEEVGRLYGFDQLDLKLPLRTTKPAGKNLLNDFKTALRNKLAAGGANEVLSYSFVHGDLLKKTGLDDVDKWAFHLRNALSPDLQYYRTSLLPSLLSKVHPNIKSDMVRSDDNEFVLFEIGKAHVKKHVDEEKLPTEFERLALVVAADEKTAARKYEGSAYYLAKKYLDSLLDGQAEYKVLETNDYPITSPYQLGRSAMVYVDGELLGVIGEMRSSVRKSLKLPEFCAGFELDLGLLQSKLSHRHYMPIGQFPKTQQDITLGVGTGTSYEDLHSLLSSELQAAKQAHAFGPDYA